MKEATTRRALLRAAGLTGLGLAAMAALPGCSGGKDSAAPAAGGHDSSAVPTATGGVTPDLIDKAHEQKVKAFPAKTAGAGNQTLTPRRDGEWKVFDLTCREVEWEVEPEIKVPIMGYNDVTPGPMIRVTEGDKVRVICKNEMAESTSIHWHGILGLPNAMDGVTYINQAPIRQGESFTYEFTARNPGLHMYHSHHNAYEQITKGLVGLVVVDPADPARRYGADHEYFLMLNDGALGYTINGKRFPATEPVIAKLGERVLLRFANAGAMVHPFHLHGLYMEVVEKDGWPVPQPWKCDTLSISPGERYDAVVDATDPGVWAFHCHVLPHAESSQGMHGMVTAFIVQ